LYAEWFTAEEQRAFREGLRGFESAARARFGRPFAACTLEQQAVLLTEWDRAVAVARTSGGSLPPFAQFKVLTVVGYYTSKVGQTEELHTILDAGEADPNGPVMMPVPFRL
jgi:hypothetical protein